MRCARKRVNQLQPLGSIVTSVDTMLEIPCGDQNELRKRAVGEGDL